MNAEDRFLIVHTDPFQVARFTGLAKVLGYVPQACNDGMAAKEMLNRETPAFLLCDLSLPQADGFEVIRHLRRDPGAGTVPVVAVSSLPSLRATALKLKAELGITEVLASSLDDNSLRKVLADAAHAKATDWVRERKSEGQATAAERERLRLAAALDLSGGSEQALKALCEQAVKVFKVPMAGVNLLLDGRPRLEAQSGLPAGQESSWDPSFCSRLIEAEKPDLLIVPDARQHPLFKDNASVRAGLVAAYMGAPLQSPSGQVLGTFCVACDKPLSFKMADAELLRLLARRVAGELEQRRQQKMQAEAGAKKEARLGLLASVIGQLETGILIMDGQRRIVLANPALAVLAGRPLDRIVGRTGTDFAKDNIALFDDPALYIHAMKVLPEGPYVAREDFLVQRPEPRWLRWTAKPIQLPDGPGQMDFFEDVTLEYEIRELRALAA